MQDESRQDDGGDRIEGRQDGRHVEARVLTSEEELIRRQHLQLLLFSARTALARHDSSSYRVALAQSRRWLGDYFDLADPVCQAMLEEIQALEPMEIDPTLPELSGSSRELRRLVGARRGPE